MSDTKWYTDKLLELPDKLEDSFNELNMIKYLARLSELELAYLNRLMSLEITSRGSEDGVTSLNRDEEKLERWP